MIDYQNRIDRLQRSLKKHSCDGVLIEDPTNLYYLTGCDVSTGKLIVDQKKAHLLVDNRYYEKCQQQCPFSVLLYQKEQSLSDFFASSKIETLGFCATHTSYARYLQLQKSLKKQKLKSLSNPIGELRCIKDASEIQLLREAAKLGCEGFDFVCSQLKAGVTEKDLALELEIFWRRKGGKALAFDPIIAFGANSSMPHYRVGEDRLKPGQPVLIDIGVNYKHYHSDMTRVLFFGEPDPKMIEIYEIVREAQEEALSYCQPGTLIGKLDEVARQLIEGRGYGENFTHSLGHGIGLEIHESPLVRSTSQDKDSPLEPGMVLTIEPGIYIPNFGGVRIEDTVVITEDGHENLTNRPKECNFP